MAIAFDSAQNGGAGASGINAAHTFSFNNVAGNIVLVDVHTSTIGVADYVTGVTYNSVAMTRVFDSGNAGNGSNDRTFIYRLVAPATGSNNVVISTNMANAFDAVNGNAVSYSGVNQSSPIDSFAVAVSADAATPFNVSTTVVGSNCWLHGAFSSSDRNPATGTGTTERAEVSSGGFLNSADSNGTVSTGSQTLQWTAAGNAGYAAGVLSLAPTASGPANVKTFDGLVAASVKTVNGLAVASVKTVNGLA